MVMRRNTLTTRIFVPVLTAFSFAVPMAAQSSTEQKAAEQQPFVFKVDVVGRTTMAINFHHRQGSTEVGLKGTNLAPKAKGEVRVDSKTGATKVDAYVDNLPPAQELQDGYLTYVLWAITPEGRPQNLGELMLNGDHAKLQASTELQSFGLLVTAEPYYAVTQPSDYVILEGVIKSDSTGTTTGTIMPIETRYDLVRRDGYLRYVAPADRLTLKEARNKIPLDLLEARQALAVARSAGGERYAEETMKRATMDMQNAESFFKSGADRKKVQTLARHVTQLAEDARLISVKRGQEEATAFERATNEKRQAELQRTAENEEAARLRAEAETKAQRQEAAEAAKRAAEEQRVAAENMARKEAQLTLETERARAAAAMAELEREKQRALEAEMAKTKLEAEVAQRQRVEAMERQKLLEEQTRAAQQKAEAAAAEQRNLEAEAQRAKEAAAKAESDRLAMRKELLRQLNVVLVARESARGLIVNMSDVLFTTGSDSLKPGAREKLSRIAGIILAHPGLKIEVEGHTDSVGSEAMNQRLSEKRAGSVRSYLVRQGIPEDAIVARGFGEAQPVADNSSPAGRQANRRVELVVNGAMLRAPGEATQEGSND